MASGIFPQNYLPADAQQWRRRVEGDSRATTQGLQALASVSLGDNRSSAGQLGMLSRTVEAAVAQAGELQAQSAILASSTQSLSNQADRLDTNAAELALQVTQLGSRADYSMPVANLPGTGAAVNLSGSFAITLPVTGLVAGRRRLVQIFMESDKTQTPAGASATQLSASLAGGSASAVLVPPQTSQPGDTPQTITLFADVPASQATVTINWTYRGIYFQQPGGPSSIDERGWFRNIYISTSIGSQ